MKSILSGISPRSFKSCIFSSQRVALETVDLARALVRAGLHGKPIPVGRKCGKGPRMRSLCLVAVGSLAMAVCAVESPPEVTHPVPPPRSVEDPVLGKAFNCINALKGHANSKKDVDLETVLKSCVSNLPVGCKRKRSGRMHDCHDKQRSAAEAFKYPKAA